jgi:hypothetical protein
MKHINIADLPTAYQQQAAAQLAGNAPSIAKFEPQATGRTNTATKPKNAKNASTRKKTGSRNVPNLTERRFNAEMLGGNGLFEAITFRLPGGSRYTPDFIRFDDDGAIDAYEVKGSYRFPSEGRAVTAWRECIAAFPWIRFFWYQWDRKKWNHKHEQN